MQRLIVLLLALVLPAIACTFEFQTMPQVETETATEPAVPGETQSLEGPDIRYNGTQFTLDPALGSRVYVFDQVTTIDGATAHHTRFALNPEEFCQTWCVMVYPVAEFKQAFGDFVFPPAGYRGGANIIFRAQEKTLSFQNGSGERALETAGHDHYGVSNEALKYVFRGYTTDQQYGVYVEVPVQAANLPAVAPTMTNDIQDILQYNQQAAASMNALAPADFTPHLDLLDALVASIQAGTP